jgi:hypothetical protein
VVIKNTKKKKKSELAVRELKTKKMLNRGTPTI